MQHKKLQIKNRYFLAVLLLLCISVINLNAQENDPQKARLEKAREILEQSRNTSGKKTSPAKGISYVISVTRHLKIVRNSKVFESEEQGERQLHVSFPNKLKYSESLWNGNDTTVSEYVLNENKYASEVYSMSDGKRMELQTKGEEKPSEERQKTDALRLKKKIFLNLFPAFLETSEYLPVAFSYFGKAMSDKESADVLETILPDTSRIRVLIDDRTHLLKMMIDNGKNQQNGEYEEKRFFSDYKEVGGLMLPGKINIERKESTPSLTAEMTEEIILKSIKLNPVFKSSFFEVKK